MLAGTLASSLLTVVMSAVLALWPVLAVAGEWPPTLLTTISTITITRTASTLPLAMNIRRRDSARRAAACCAAILSRAFIRRIRSALPMPASPFAPGNCLLAHS